MQSVVFFGALWIARGLHLQDARKPSGWISRCAQRCSMQVERACAESYSSAWDVKECGGWAPQNLQNGIPQTYAKMLKSAKTSVDVLEQPVPADASGDIFCYGATTSEETFELVRKIGQMCDGYMYFSNFSNPDLHVVKILDGSMHALQGGNFQSSLNTPVFIPIFRYVATNFAKRYKWFIKYDMDTVFQPNKLRATLAQFDHTQAGIVETGLGPGAIHIASSSAMVQYASQHKSCEDELGEFFPAEDVYFNPSVWDSMGVTPKECKWTNTSFVVPAGSKGRSIIPCELNSLVQRSSSEMVHAMELENRVDRSWLCPPQAECEMCTGHRALGNDDLRSALFMHPVKNRAAYAAMLDVLGLLK
jgi:hypothetical protein